MKRNCDINYGCGQFHIQALIESDNHVLVESPDEQMRFIESLHDIHEMI